MTDAYYYTRTSFLGRKKKPHSPCPFSVAVSMLGKTLCKFLGPCFCCTIH
jgi:hypothetical protein